jgi:hypothetical protein
VADGGNSGVDPRLGARDASPREAPPLRGARCLHGGGAGDRPDELPESHPHPAEGGRAGREAEDRVDAVPLNVAKTCTLTSMCASQNIHPNAQGYGVIAQAFAAALR